MGKTGQYVDEKNTESRDVAGRRADVKQPRDEKKRDILDVVPVHAPGTLDIFVWQQLVRAWMRIADGPLCILSVAIPAFYLHHSKDSDPSLGHHLHDHQCRRDRVVAENRVVEGQQAHRALLHGTMFDI